MRRVNKDITLDKKATTQDKKDILGTIKVLCEQTREANKRIKIYIFGLYV